MPVFYRVSWATILGEILVRLVVVGMVRLFRVSSRKARSWPYKLRPRVTSFSVLVNRSFWCILFGFSSGRTGEAGPIMMARQLGLFALKVT